MDDATAPPSARATVKRHSERAQYDRAVVDPILDEGYVCHFGFIGADGAPYVIPTLYARLDETVYIHGSPASRLIRIGKSGVDVCLTVTLVDGFVLARSAFHHTMNYRSVVVLGRATEVSDLGEKARRFELFVDKLVPGRSAEARPANETELRGTTLLALPLDEATAKTRSGFGLEEPEDVDLPVWSGIIGLEQRWGSPQPDDLVRSGTSVPRYVEDFRRSGAHPR